MGGLRNPGAETVPMIRAMKPDHGDLGRRHGAGRLKDGSRITIRAHERCVRASNRGTLPRAPAHPLLLPLPPPAAASPAVSRQTSADPCSPRPPHPRLPHEHPLLRQLLHLQPRGRASGQARRGHLRSWRQMIYSSNSGTFVDEGRTPLSMRTLSGDFFTHLRCLQRPRPCCLRACVQRTEKLGRPSRA